MAKKWGTILIRQELLAATEKTLERGQYSSLSKFVSEAIRIRLDELKIDREKNEKQDEHPIIQERLLYTPNHMWVMVTPEGNVRVGLSDYAKNHLKGISSIQLKPVGYEVDKKEPFGLVKTWIFTFDLYSPVVGKIVKINRFLLAEPSLIDKAPSEVGWMVEVKPNNLITLQEELRDLMRPSQYKTWVSRLLRPRILGA